MYYPMHQSELDGLLALMVAEGCRSVLEIGSLRGQTLVQLAHAMPVGSRLVSVDLPNGPWGRADSLLDLSQRVDELRVAGYLVDLLLGDSHDEAMIRRVAKRGPYDLAFIDGDHTYQGVKADFETYGAMARLVALHDIHPETMDRQAEPYRSAYPIRVARFWSEIKCDYTRKR